MVANKSSISEISWFWADATSKSHWITTQDLAGHLAKVVACTLFDSDVLNLCLPTVISMGHGKKWSKWINLSNFMKGTYIWCLKISQHVKSNVELLNGLCFAQIGWLNLELSQKWVSRKVLHFSSISTCGSKGKIEVTTFYETRNDWFLMIELSYSFKKKLNR